MPKKPTEIFAKKVNPTGVYNQESLIKAIHSMRKEINTEQISNVTGSNPFVSTEDDLSDVSVYLQKKSPVSATDYVLLDVSDGPKTCLQIYFSGWRVATTGGSADRIGPVTIDGNVVGVFPMDTGYNSKDQGGAIFNLMVGYPIRYDSSLKVEWRQTGTGKNAIVSTYILGSGPYSIAVVKDGEPVYMTAENVGEYQIENMNVPSGYKIVRNPNITHEDPQNRGMWDDSKGEVVDHPFEKPFHETLDKLSQRAERTSVQDVINRIEKNPTSFNNVFKGKLPKEDPVEEAIQFWKEKEEERTLGLTLSDIRKG